MDKIKATVTQMRTRWQRLGSMPRDEMLDRLRQTLAGRLDFLRHRVGFGFGNSGDEGNVPGHSRFFFSAEAVPGLCALLKRRFPEQAKDIVRRAERICEHRFDLLGYEELQYGAGIDWHLDRVHGKRAPHKPFYLVHYLNFDEVGDSKVTWELNRHQHLVTLAKAYRLTGNAKFASEIFQQWRHWHAENPYPIGINWASSLEVAFRSLSWLWVYFLLEGSPALPSGFRAEWLRALAVSGRHIARQLSTFFSPNTHLLGEGVALFFVGTICPQLGSADRWKQRGWQIVLNEARRQVQSDGMHFEQSTYYHVYAIDLFLHAAVLASVNDIPLPPEFERTLEKMLDALCFLGRAGTPPRLGDDDGGRVFDPRRNRAEHMLDPLATGAVLFGRGDFKRVSEGLREETLWLLGEPGVREFDRIEEKPVSTESVALPASGLYLITSGRGQQLVVDAGPQGAASAGHGHADALSVWLNVDGRPQLVDPGTFEYIGEDSERDAFRGTAAHNTLVVDGMDQAQPHGPFGWESLPTVRAEGWISGHNFDLFVGSHDGYTRLASPVTHRRWVFSLRSHFWLMRDMALGADKHQLDLFWHLSPEFSGRGRVADTFLDRSGREGLCLMTAKGHGWSHDMRKDSWSPVYGCKERFSVLHFGTVAALPVEFVTLLIPVVDGRMPAGELARHADSKEVAAYRYAGSEEEHCMFFSKPGSTWTAGPWTTDAEFLYWGKTASRRLLICCNGSYVSEAGRKIVSSPRSMLRCEILARDEHLEIYCSEPEAMVDKEAGMLMGTEDALTNSTPEPGRTRS